MKEMEGEMLYEIVKDFPNDIIYEEGGPFISLYQPTHRYRPENKQDVIRFKNLIRTIENSLKEKYRDKELQVLMKPFNDLAEDNIFWNNTKDGLAVLSNGRKCIVYKLKRPVEEVALVGDTFHIGPLIRNFQSDDKFHLLGLDRKEFTLFEGNRYGFEEIEIDPSIDTKAEDVLGDERTEPHLTAGSYGGAENNPMFHGHGGRKEEVDLDAERFFRYVDKVVLDHYSNPTKVPLILVALDEHQGLFRSLTNNPYLIDKGIRKDYRTLSVSDIRENAWELIEPKYLEQTKVLTDRYNVERPKSLASDDLAEVARAVLENKVATLIVESDRIVPGKLNKETGQLEMYSVEKPDFENLLDDLAMMMYKNKGEIIILPKGRMPSTTGLAAIFRY
jgi:hypothetical protein